MSILVVQGDRTQKVFGDPWVYVGNQWNFLPIDIKSWWTVWEQLQYKQRKHTKASWITTTSMERNHTTMAPRSSANSAFGQEKYTRFARCWIIMQTTPNDTQRWSGIHQESFRKLGTYWQSRTWSPDRAHGPFHLACNPWDQHVCWDKKYWTYEPPCLP